MRRFAAASLAAGLLTIAAAKDAPAPAPAADPKTVELIHELALPENPVALRDQPGWRAPKRIILATANPNGTSAAQQLDPLKAVAPGVEIVAVANAAELAKQVATADAIIGGDDTVCDDQVLAAAKKNLRWVAIMSAGVEACLGKPALERPGLTVTNMRAVAGPVMAEHTIALMFALSRSLQVSIGRQATGEGWNRSFFGSQPQALEGKTLLVVGLGGIGTEVARRAHGLGMKVIATRNSSRSGPDYVSHVGLPDELPTLIAQADVVVSALPLVPATTNLFDAKMFARMKKTAFFINVGRGGSVVTDDLVAALNAGTIAGAGLDVTEPEPLPKDHALWKAKNVVITPHMSALSDLGQTARIAILREQVRRYAAGDKLLAVVDFKKGY
ncbi:MAG TPA: D-2-hydroxyacid dehydrogenase [Steroidobacteraceae bacterium]|nr:D-2-hydroxyacid dehydrogenase [Steroidobacteraceae bacterium]